MTGGPDATSRSYSIQAPLIEPVATRSPTRDPLGREGGRLGTEEYLETTYMAVPRG